ncbi:hypothetical protein [Pseudomonas sp. TWR2-1-1]|uniref:hypothetical protein n=1 Tax=Pseudomonas sp. TWR2-1-1 TaxID=2804610 RepID=UPI003CF1720B
MHQDYGVAPSSYQRWSTLRRADPLLIEDAQKANHWRQSPSPTPIIKLQKEQPTGPRRGRPALNTPNPVATLMFVIGIKRPQWLDDIVYGSVTTSAGTSKGKLNVRPGAVLSALYSNFFSVEALGREGQPERTTMLIAKVARHAAHGIIEYLQRHPELHSRLKREADLEAELKCKQ